MAENESLDLGTHRFRRWDEVCNDIKNGAPWEKVAPKVSRKLHDSLRKVWRQLAENGVPFDQLLAARNSPGVLNQLVKNSGNHPYALLFRDVCFSENAKDAKGVLTSFAWAAWETIADQIEHRLASPTEGRSLVDLQIFVNEVNHLIEADINRLAQKLTENPTQVPKRLSRKDSKTDPTMELLPMSLLGVSKP